MNLSSSTSIFTKMSAEQVGSGQLHSLIIQCNSLSDHSKFVRMLDMVRSLFQYDRFACAVIDTTSYRTLYFFNLNFSDECLKDLHMRECGKNPDCPLSKEWYQACEPLWLNNVSTPHQNFSSSLIKHELQSLVVHGLRSVTGTRASTFFFGRSTDVGNPDDLLMLPLLIPPLHMGLSNMMSQSHALSMHPSTMPDLPANAELFTPREIEVTKWLVYGKTNAEIAYILNISTFTVKNHIQKILFKLNVSNRTQAATRAIDLGIVATHSSK